MLYEDGTLLESMVVEDGEECEMIELLSKDVDGFVYCSVSGEDKTTYRLVAHLPAEMKRLEVTHSTPVPLAIDYATPHTLGLDRVAAAVGASRLFPGESVLVVDAGTAVTMDVVEKGPAFRGGNICCGVGMRLSALHRFTARLPEVSPEGALPVMGCDTDTALRCGAVRGVAAEIEVLYREAERRYGCSRILLTGGDAEIVARALRERGIENCRIEPWLVGIGLLTIYEYNENNE